MLHALRAPLQEQRVIATSAQVLDFFAAAIAHQPVEMVWALYLDSANRLLVDEMVARGSISHATIYPREIIKRALEVGATGIVLAHNHPSGSVHPSPSDIRMTKALQRACRGVEIALHDHLIITRGGWTSLRAEGLLDE